MEKKEDLFEAARTDVARLSASLPEHVDLGAVSRRWKTAGKAWMIRESLIWRAEELGRNALSALEADDIVVGATLTRALMETAAAIAYLHGMIAKALEDGISDDLDEKLTGFLTGSKIWEDLGGAIHVIKMLKHLQKEIPGFYDEHYGYLSEFAHPNWSGAHGAYAIINEEEITVSFQRGGRSPERKGGAVIGRLSGSLGLFIYYYDKLADMLGPFTDAVEAHYGKKD